MKGKVIITPERCKGCRLCIEVCPQKALIQSPKNNNLGIYVVETEKNSSCIGCARCAIICPETAIEVYKE